MKFIRFSFFFTILANLYAGDGQQLNLHIKWPTNHLWRVYEVQDQPWGTVQTLYLKIENWSNWSQEITYIRLNSGNMDLIVSSLETLKTKMQENFPQVQIRQMDCPENSSFKKVCFLVESGKPKEGPPQSILSYVMEKDGKVVLFQITHKNEAFPKKDLMEWQDCFRDAKLDYSLPPLIEIETGDLNSELERWKTDTVLVKQSTAIDGHPVWSPDNTKLAYNVMGVYYSMDLSTLHTQSASWHGGEIALVDLGNEQILDEATFKEWESKCKFNPRKIELASGTIVELGQEGFSTSLSISGPTMQKTTIWTSETENCHSLALSPNEEFVAYIAENNGIVVMKLDKLKIEAHLR